VAEDYAAAARHFAEALRREPSRFWAQYFLAATQLQSGQPRDALANLTACISRRPDFAWSYLLRGLANGALEVTAQSEADFARALELFGPAAPVQDHYALHLNRGITRLAAGKFVPAIEDFEAAYQFDRSRIEALVNLAEARRRLARQVGMLAAAAAPTSLPAIDALAAVNGPAVALLNEAHRLAEHDGRPLLARGRLRRDQGNLVAATQDFRRALASAPPGTRQRAVVLCELGRVFHLQKDLAQALANYQAAVEERPDHADAWYLQALALIDSARPAEALAAFDRFVNGGAALAAGAPPLSAAEVVARASQTVVPSVSSPAGDHDPAVKLAAFLRERAFARLLTRDYEGGMTDAEVAAELVRSRQGAISPADRDRFALLDARRGWSYLLDKRVAAERALKAFDQAIRTGTPHGDPLTGRAVAHITLGKYREAIADASRAVEIGPPVTGLLYNAASVYAAARPLAERDQQAADGATLSAAWLAESVALLRRAFEQANGATRAAFWTELDRDAYFDSIRDTAEFKQLRGEFDPRAGSGQ
jgi:tetratricopeptide (TPR) repeat protein